MATAARPAARWRNDRLFYTGMGVFVALVGFTGFARTYYLSRWFEAPQGTPAIDALLHIHGAVFTAWLVLAAVQPALVAGGNRRLHRRLGYFGAATALSMAIVGNITAIAAMKSGFLFFPNKFAFYAIPFFAINTFALLVALAVLWRNRAETHKRLMLLSSTQIIEAALARLDAMQPGAPFSFTFGADIIIVAGIAYDLVSRGKVHKVWVWGGAAVVLSQIMRLWIMNTQGWQGFAQMMAGLW
jgi:hypothetical protein